MKQTNLKGQTKFKVGRQANYQTDLTRLGWTDETKQTRSILKQCVHKQKTQ